MVFIIELDTLAQQLNKQDHDIQLIILTYLESLQSKNNNSSSQINTPKHTQLPLTKQSNNT